MRCPHCASSDDKVVDSRTVEEGASIRRRRQCLACDRRFTTYERLDLVPLVVVKRSGAREAFDLAKLVSGLRAASKNRPVDAEMAAVAGDVEDTLRLEGPEVESATIGAEVLRRLRELDEVSYLRFASVSKGFTGVEDFRREVGLLEGLPEAAASAAFTNDAARRP